MFFLRIEKNIILDCFFPFASIQGNLSSGLDLFCYVLILNDVHELI